MPGGPPPLPRGVLPPPSTSEGVVSGRQQNPAPWRDGIATELGAGGTACRSGLLLANADPGHSRDVRARATPAHRHRHGRMADHRIPARRGRPHPRTEPARRQVRPPTTPRDRPAHIPREHPRGHRRPEHRLPHRDARGARRLHGLAPTGPRHRPRSDAPGTDRLQFRHHRRHARRRRGHRTGPGRPDHPAHLVALDVRRRSGVHRAGDPHGHRLGAGKPRTPQQARRRARGRSPGRRARRPAPGDHRRHEVGLALRRSAVALRGRRGALRRTRRGVGPPVRPDSRPPAHHPSADARHQPRGAADRCRAVLLLRPGPATAAACPTACRLRSARRPPTEAA